MSFRDSGSRFGWVTISIHWLMVALIGAMLYVGFHIANLPRGTEKMQMIGVHKSIGVFVLILALTRLLWRLVNPMPDMMGTPKPWQRLLARLVQFGLLFLLILMPVSGWLMSSAGGHPVTFFGLFSLPHLVSKSKLLGETFHAIHESVAFGILFLLFLHISAALKHVFIDRDKTVMRMLGRSG